MHHSWSELEDTSPWSQSWEHCLCVWISASPLSLISVVFPASCFVRIVRNFADAYLDSSSRYPEKVLTQTLKKTNFWLFLIHRQRQTLLSQPRQPQFSTLYTTSQFVCVSRIKEKKTHSLCSLYSRRIFSTGWSLVMNCLFVFIQNGISERRLSVTRRVSFFVTFGQHWQLLSWQLWRLRSWHSLYPVQCLEIQGRPKSDLDHQHQNHTHYDSKSTHLRRCRYVVDML